jgi:hypothetical protein
VEFTLDPDGRDRNPLNLAEVKLFSAAGRQFSSANLTVEMTSQFERNDAQNCIDGDTNTICQTSEYSSTLESLRVSYPCAQGLSRVEVVNRLDDFKDRITYFRMRATSGSKDSDMFPPYLFAKPNDVYTWYPGEKHRPGMCFTQWST